MKRALRNVGVAATYFWRRHSIESLLVTLIAAMVLLAWGMTALEKHEREQARLAAIHQADLARERKVKAYAEQRDTIIGGIRASIAKHDLDGASAEAAQWHDVGDGNLKLVESAIVDEKYKAFLVEKEKRQRQETKDRIQREKEERAAARADLAFRRTQGVSVGMTEKEVLESSWGRPESVNRSIYSFGVHEQWVYPGFQFLYFENGKLTSIQTH